MRIKLWLRARRQGCLWLAPFRVTGRYAPSALSRIRLEPGVRIGQFAWFSLMGERASVTVGRDTTLSASFAVSAEGPIVIGSGTVIAERCLISDHGHDYEGYLEPALTAGGTPQFGWGTTEPKPVVIGNGVHIGVGCVILPGVTIGDGAVVGANSVVTKSVPPYTVVAGAPARVLRQFAADQS